MASSVLRIVRQERRTGAPTPADRIRTCYAGYRRQYASHERVAGPGRDRGSESSAEAVARAHVGEFAGAVPRLRPRRVKVR